MTAARKEVSWYDPEAAVVTVKRLTGVIEDTLDVTFNGRTCQVNFRLTMAECRLLVFALEDVTEPTTGKTE